MQNSIVIYSIKFTTKMQCTITLWITHNTNHQCNMNSEIFVIIRLWKSIENIINLIFACTFTNITFSITIKILQLLIWCVVYLLFSPLTIRCEAILYQTKLLSLSITKMKESQPIPAIEERIQKCGAVNKCTSNKFLKILRKNRNERK